MEFFDKDISSKAINTIITNCKIEAKRIIIEK